MRGEAAGGVENAGRSGRRVDGTQHGSDFGNRRTDGSRRIDVAIHRFHHRYISRTEAVCARYGRFRFIRLINAGKNGLSRVPGERAKSSAS